MLYIPGVFFCGQAVVSIIVNLFYHAIPGLRSPFLCYPDESSDICWRKGKYHRTVE